MSMQLYFTYTDCPPGLAGDNCSDPCPYPRYGALCNDTCDCSSSLCHHVYGCNITISTETGTCRYTRDGNEFSQVTFVHDRVYT